MIEFRDVSKAFGPKRVLDRVSFRILPGEIVFIIGKSGMGKSVLLKNIMGLIRPDSGEIWVGEREVSRLGEEDYYEVRRECGMVFQLPALLDSLTIYENLAFGLRAHGLADREAVVEEKVLKALALVGLGEEVLPKLPPELSFGMQKRASLARSLVLDPKYLLFDEPTTSLDPVSTHAVNALIHELSRKLGVTSMVVSHDMHCALEIADRILLLEGGRIVVEGTPEAFLASSHPVARAFMEEAGARMGERKGKPASADRKEAPE